MRRSRCEEVSPAFVNFGPIHTDVLGRYDPKPHPIPFYPSHPDADAAVDHDIFADPACQN
jgi:hypothetical protein